MKYCFRNNFFYFRFNKIITPTVLKKTTVFLLLILSVTASAQTQKPKNDSAYDDRPLHFGFSLGLNTMDFNVKTSDANYAIDSLVPEVSLLKPGVNIQVVINYRPADYFDIRFLPGVSLGQRTIRYYKNGVLVNGEQTLESSFLEFPLLLKYKGMRLNNSRPYLITGLNLRYDLAGKKEYDPETNIYLRLHRADLYYEVGAGLDFYLPEFKLSIEVKMSNGLRDVLVHDAPTEAGTQQYSNAISSLRSQMWILAFHFE
jgi:hypothetical protein